MKLIYRLERKFGHLAIRNLIRWVVLLNAITWAALQVQPSLFYQLYLDPARVMRGEVWRLFTYIYIPPAFDPIWILFALYFAYLIGEGLEKAWGAFAVNLYYLLGMLSTTVIAFLFRGAVDNTFLNTSLFLAFATLYPDMVINIFLILPVRLKWLGWLAAAGLLVGFLRGPGSARAAIAVALLNYCLFFGGTLRERIRLGIDVQRARSRFQPDRRAAHGKVPFHVCATCHRTELDEPRLEFRVAEDGREYCLEHLP